MRISKSFIRFLKSFGYAARGIASAVRTERNMRFHLGAAAFVIWIMRFYDLTGAESAVLFLCIGGVIGAELFNTAAESLVDLVTKDRNDIAKKAKDCASGAVLVMALVSVICGVFILWDTAVFAHIWTVMTDRVWRIAAFLALLLLWLWFVFCFGDNKDKEVNDDEQ